MLVKLAFRVVPMQVTTAMMATEMAAAMRPYSLAVAPDSSFTKRETRVFIAGLLRSTWLSDTPSGPRYDPSDQNMTAGYRGRVAIKLIAPMHSEIYRGGEIVVNNEFSLVIPSIDAE